MEEFQPQMLLQMAADQALTRQIADYTSSVQFDCQKHCESKFVDDQQEKEQLQPDLTMDSLLALERQCNKLCIRKMLKAYTFQQSLIMGKFK